MNKIDIIIQPVQDELKAFDKFFKEILRGHNEDFQFMINFIAGKNGKRIRPLILILSAKLCGEINQNSIKYAAILELLHNATLIHDDVVDNTMERRGQPSVNAEYNNQIAVLLGDYILSLAITMGVETRSFEVLEILARLSRNLAEGELTQLISSKESIIDEKRYFEVIRKKTAILLSSCSEMGALSVNADKDKIEKLRLIGENLGLCFQIKDDVFDYYEPGEIGKPTGNDIREGKVTLPLIHALNSAPKEISEPMLDIIYNQEFSTENIKVLADFAKEYKGIEYAYNKMYKIKEDILVLLDEFSDSEIKTAMINLVDYIIERNS